MIQFFFQLRQLLYDPEDKDAKIVKKQYHFFGLILLSMAFLTFYLILSMSLGFDSFSKSMSESIADIYPSDQSSYTNFSYGILTLSKFDSDVFFHSTFVGYTFRFLVDSPFFISLSSLDESVFFIIVYLDLRSFCFSRIAFLLFNFSLFFYDFSL